MCLTLVMSLTLVSEVFAQGAATRLPAVSAAGELTLGAAVNQAITGDPWLSGSQYREQALISESAVAATLPDPKLNLMAGNFPVDTFDIQQEPMTQVGVGVSQMFPRGDSLELSSRQKRELADQESWLRLDRRAQVRRAVSTLWLEAYEAQESIQLIERDRSLFEHLVDAARASYASALGGARQHHIIRAQLELTRLDDRLTVLRQNLESAQRRLSEWIGSAAFEPLSGTLRTPEDHVAGIEINASMSAEALYRLIEGHPSLRALDQRIVASQTGVELAQQKYKPEWGLSLQYGYRADTPAGLDRADLFSVGVSFDMPLFTEQRQDQEVSAASSRTSALQVDKTVLSRRLVAELETVLVQLRRLAERHALYSEQLLPQMAEQAAASLAAYNSNDGDFAEAVRSRIAELNAKIEFLSLRVARHKTLTTLDYLIAPTFEVSGQALMQ